MHVPAVDTTTGPSVHSLAGLSPRQTDIHIRAAHFMGYRTLGLTQACPKQLAYASV